MNRFFRWLFRLSRSTREAQKRIEATAMGIAADFEEARLRNRMALGLDTKPEPKALRGKSK